MKSLPKVIIVGLLRKISSLKDELAQVKRDKAVFHDCLVDVCVDNVCYYWNVLP